MRDMLIPVPNLVHSILNLCIMLALPAFARPVPAADAIRTAHKTATVAPPGNARVNHGNGVLSIRLSNGERRRYKSNLRVDGGTYVEYRYKGYLNKIDAYVIEAEKMNSETIFLSDRTGKEAYVGSAYSISPNGKTILSAGCIESLSCFYELIKWPSAQRELFKEQERATGIAIAPSRPQETPIKWTSVRWRSNVELLFSAACVAPRGKMEFAEITLKYAGGRWQQQKNHACIGK